MLVYMWKRAVRQPLMPIAMILVAMVLSVILCSLHASSEKEAADYEEIYRNTPVTVSVTDLTGLRQDNLSAPRWVVNAFNEAFPIDNGLAEYVKDVRVKMSVGVLSGLTDMEAEPLFTPRMGGNIQWREGYDASCFGGKEYVCIVPEDSEYALEPDEITLTLSYVNGFGVTKTTTIDLTVAGTHALGNGEVYCPFWVVQYVCGRLDKSYEADAVSAVLKDNSRLEEFREAASQWFTEPNYSGEKTPWDYSWYFYYPYALKINDSQLRSAQTTMENSRIINTICAFVVFAVATGAGFLIGFQTVRSRRREIALMRTMGTPDISVYFTLVSEQMVCILLGTLLGGVAFGWRPLYQLGIFAGVYFIGLTIAMLIALRNNLLAIIKEEE